MSYQHKLSTWEWLRIKMSQQFVSPADFKKLKKACLSNNQEYYWKASVKIDGNWKAVTIASWPSELYNSEDWEILSQYGLDHAVEKCLIEGYKVECIRIK